MFVAQQMFYEFTSSSIETSSKGSELIAVYRVSGEDPKHLESLPWGMLQPNGSARIDLAHKLGLAHAGVYIAVCDSAGRVLLLQRGPELKTCPGKWGLVGEHLHSHEDELMSVKRALDEELGPNLRRQHVSQLVNVSAVWYAQTYEDGRVERQATHVWVAGLHSRAEDVVLFPDDEVTLNNSLILAILAHTRTNMPAFSPTTQA